jgi:FkbM family methyltransferase
VKRLKHAAWITGNAYAWIFGWPALAWAHQALLGLSLHALGYDNTWRPGLTGEEWFVRTILAKNDIKVCLDVGANIGRYSDLLLTNLETEVYAVEPSVSSFKSLEESARRRPGSLHPIRAALSDTIGTGTLYAKSAGAETATLDRSLLSVAPLEEEVRVTTADALVAELGLKRLDFVKIDTEGYEREVLSGMKETLQRLRPFAVQFEFNHLQLKRGYSVYDLSALLPGYDLYRLLPHGRLPIDPTRASANIFMFSNVIAIRKGATETRR